MRTEDEDIERFLKFFTFLPMNDIQNIVARHLVGATYIIIFKSIIK